MDRTTPHDTPARRRPRRRIVAVALATLLAVPAAVTLPATPAAASSCPNAAGSYAGGDGSAGNPFLISTPAELVELAGDTANYDKAFRLTSAIELADCDWTPIGTTANPFGGTFDGNDLAITGLNVDGTGDGNFGLFGVTRGATIRDLTVVGAIDVGGTSGRTFLGGLVGRAEGTLVISGLLMRVDVTHTGSGTGSTPAVGGVIGLAGRDDVGGSVIGADAVVTARGVRVEGAVRSTETTDVEPTVGGLLGRLAAGSSLTVERLPAPNDALPAFELRASAGVPAVTARQNAGGMVGASYGPITASHIRIQRSVETSGNGAGGVIGLVTQASVVLADVEISGDVSSGRSYAGGIIARAELAGSATVDVTISSVTVMRSVHAAKDFAGGIFGQVQAGPNVTFVVRDVMVNGDVVAVDEGAGGIIGDLQEARAGILIEASTVGTATTRVEATKEGGAGGVIGVIGEDVASEVGLDRTIVRSRVVAGTAPAGCLVGEVDSGSSGSVAVTDSFSRSTVTIGGAVTQCEFPPDAAPPAGPSFVAPGGVIPSAPVGSGEWVQADGSAVPLAVSSPGRNQVRYVADGVQVTFTGGAGSDVSRGLVADQNGEVVCEICLQLAAGQVIEVWMFSEPRLVAAHLTQDLPCQRFSVPVVSPLDGGGPVVAGAHTLQLALPTASGMQAVNVGVTVGGRVPGSVPAGEGPAAGGGVPVVPSGGMFALVLAVVAGGVLASRRRVEG